jgi:outer membrane protein
MMRKTVIALLIVACVLATADTKIGFIDSERIFEGYQATRAANVEFNEFVTLYRDSAATLKQNIQNLKNELEGQTLVLSEEARLRKLDEIETLTSEYNAFLDEVFGSGGKIEQKNDVLIAPLLKDINESVAKIAETEGFSLVIDLSEGVYYASSELDLTDLVIDDLNLEYGPQTTAGEVTKAIAIFPFREENTQAYDAGLGDRAQDELYEVISIFSQDFKIIDKTSVRGRIFQQGYGRDITEDQAYSVGEHLLADYIIVGSISKFATKIDYTMSVKQVATKTEIGRRSNSVTEEIRLTEQLNSDLRALIEMVKRQ